MDALRKAIIDAGTELGSEHGWCFDEDESATPSPDGYFVEILIRHITPLISGEYRDARIAALKAELAALSK